MPTFSYPLLAGVAAAAAAVPVIVHLLNRRRFRVVQWAAMDFLREAVSRSRRILELRDLLLLLLRVLCLLAFAFAIGRPYWNRSTQTAIDPNQPVHAVVLVDNSLSMSYQKFDGILLDEAKAKAKELIEGLPHGSVISVVPTCGSAGGVSSEVYSRPEDALEALTAIKTMDRATRAGPVISLALDVCGRTTNMSSKKIFLVTDQQVAGWSSDAERENLKQLPCPMQIVQVSADEIENAWVADVQLRDGVADAEAPAIFIAKIGYQGPAPRTNVQVTLKIDGTTVSSQSVNLEPGQIKDVEFAEYRFPAPAEKGKASYSSVEVSIPHDRLPGDDQRSLIVPVTASLPVVFVDALGPEEKPQEGQYGDTWWLRRLLAPRTEQSESEQPSLIQVRQLKMDQLNRETLADARLVVIAGVPTPTPAAIPVLMQFVEQGGNVILAGGGGFDPEAWSKIAWKDGEGILPAPLERECVGALREDTASQAIPFVMKFETLAHQYFWPEGESEEDMRGRFGPPTLFFKAMVPQYNDGVLAQAAKAANDYFGGQRKRLAEIDGQLAKLDSGKSGDSAKALQDRDDLLKQRDGIQPSWLAWRRGSVQEEGEQLSPEKLADRAKPVVLGRYSNDVPMLVRRQWGKGQVLLLTTSLSPQWTTLPEMQQSWWLMDRIVRSLLTETLRSWNLSSEGSFVLPVASGERSARYTVTDPDGQLQVLSVDAQGGDRFGVSLGNWSRRGVYRVTATRPSDSGEGEGTRLWEIPMAVNGPAEESMLAIDGAGKAKSDQNSFSDATSQAYSIAPVTKEGVDSLWKWLIGLAMVLLLAELLLAVKYTARVETAR
ncbi:MAG: BatA domain-containing protein [Planctomycetota bacterium]